MPRVRREVPRRAGHVGSRSAARARASAPNGVDRRVGRERSAVCPHRVGTQRFNGRTRRPRRGLPPRQLEEEVRQERVGAGWRESCRARARRRARGRSAAERAAPVVSSVSARQCCARRGRLRARTASAARRFSSAHAFGSACRAHAGSRRAMRANHHRGAGRAASTSIPARPRRRCADCARRTPARARCKCFDGELVRLA